MTWIRNRPQFKTRHLFATIYIVCICLFLFKNIIGFKYDVWIHLKEGFWTSLQGFTIPILGYNYQETIVRLPTKRPELAFSLVLGGGIGLSCALALYSILFWLTKRIFKYIIGKS